MEGWQKTLFYNIVSQLRVRQLLHLSTCLTAMTVLHMPWHCSSSSLLVWKTLQWRQCLRQNKKWNSYYGQNSENPRNMLAQWLKLRCKDWAKEMACPRPDGVWSVLWFSGHTGLRVMVHTSLRQCLTYKAVYLQSYMWMTLTYCIWAWMATRQYMRYISPCNLQLRTGANCWLQQGVH